MKTASSKENIQTIKPTIVFSKRVDVGFYNDAEMRKLPGEVYTYMAQDELTYMDDEKSGLNHKWVRDEDDASSLESAGKRLKAFLDTTLPEVVVLKVGAQVMLKANIDTENGLVNGSRGVVVHVSPYQVGVQFKNHIEPIAITHLIHSIDDKRVKLERKQIPLILAWACTIHSSQGSTLDYAIVDIGTQIFCPAQAYVAMSRVRSLDSMLISAFYPKSIYAHRAALQFVMNLEKDDNIPINKTHVNSTTFVLKRCKCCTARDHSS
jgi:hypothetical protein